MMACSVLVQAYSLYALRRSIRWRGSLVFIVGGALGVLPALYLLNHVDVRAFRTGFGAFLVCYAAYMLLRPAMARVADVSHWLREGAVGFGGGLVGGLTAMPGALPTIWCDLRGMPNDQQRGLVQPFIAVMQVFALTLMLSCRTVTTKTVVDLAVTLPALLAGTGLGLAMFGRINEAWFRRSVLALLLVAGLALVL